MRRRTSMLAVPLLVGLTLVTGCVESEQSRDVDAIEGAFELLRSRDEAVDAVRYTRTLAEHLPNQRISLDGSTPVATSSGVVVGEVSDAEVVGAHRIAVGEDGEELPGGSPLPVDVDDADWYDIAVTVNVSDTWSNHVHEGDEIRLGVSYAGGDLATFLEGLRSLGTVIAVLDTPPIEGVFQVMWNGSTLGQVGDSGELRFPAMSDDAARDFLDGLHTVADIDEAASVSREVIMIRDFQRVG